MRRPSRGVSDEDLKFGNRMVLRVLHFSEGSSFSGDDSGGGSSLAHRLVLVIIGAVIEMVEFFIGDPRMEGIREERGGRAGLG